MTSAHRKKVRIRRIPGNQRGSWDAYTRGSGALTSATRHGGQKGKNLSTGYHQLTTLHLKGSLRQLLCLQQKLFELSRRLINNV